MEKKGSAQGTYTGPDRRKGERRKSPDRRDMIRFEPDKPERRKSRNRRKSHQTGDVWSKTHRR